MFKIIKSIINRITRRKKIIPGVFTTLIEYPLPKDFKPGIPVARFGPKNEE